MRTLFAQRGGGLVPVIVTGARILGTGKSACATQDHCDDVALTGYSAINCLIADCSVKPGGAGVKSVEVSLRWIRSRPKKRTLPRKSTSRSVITQTPGATCVCDASYRPPLFSLPRMPQPNVTSLNSSPF